MGLSRANKVVDLLTDYIFMDIPLGLNVHLQISNICGSVCIVLLSPHPWNILSRDTAQALERYLTGLSLVKQVTLQELNSINQAGDAGLASIHALQQKLLTAAQQVKLLLPMFIQDSYIIFFHL